MNRPRDIGLLASSSETFKREMAVMIQTGISLDGETVFLVLTPDSSKDRIQLPLDLSQGTCVLTKLLQHALVVLL